MPLAPLTLHTAPARLESVTEEGRANEDATSIGDVRCQRATRTRRALGALVAAIGLATGLGCGDAADLAKVSASERTVGALVTVKIPGEPTEGWILPDKGVKTWAESERTGLLFAGGDEPLSVTFPAPPEAEGAGHVTLRVMSDGPFSMQLALGPLQTRVARSGDTRRRWKEMTFSLRAPLTGDALTGPLRIIRDSATLPVVVEAIRFLP